MRKLFTTTNLDDIRRFTAQLSLHSIQYDEEEQSELDWGKETYGTKQYVLWIINEDDYTRAKELYDAFVTTPVQPNTPEPPVQILSEPGKQFIERKLKAPLFDHGTVKRKPSTFNISFFLSLACSFIFLLCLINRDDKIPEALGRYVLTTSPVEKALLFDYPEKYELVDKIGSVYGYEAFLKPSTLPKAGKFLYNEYLVTPAWEGFYPQLLPASKEETKQPKLFEKIAQGELWRCISPIFLHNDILHLFFNLAWLLFIGVQIERHVGKIRYLLFIAITACASNSCQYLVSGPAFLGFSGVICAMVFFIHARQKSAPWEGYFLPKSAFHFVLFFISILAFLSLLAFGLEFFQLGHFPVFIANTGHLTGALTGYLLGKTNFFSWRFE